MPQTPSTHLCILRSTILVLTLFVLTCARAPLANAAELAPFSSDGCSLFPDGTPSERNRWCDCCLVHDLAYWQGGTAEERNQADAALRACVLTRTNDTNLSETMYLGVRAGGHPAFPTWYRWGYGWPYGSGYRALTAADREQVQRQLATYRQQHPQGYCSEEHPAAPPPR